jgi:DNA-binding response OmpR family regulator
MPELIRTLVVDDEERIRFFLQETLQRAGHVVTTASSGEVALDRLQDTPFDLVMLDLRLGGRVDGQRVLEAIRWRWPATVVIMLTAHGTLESTLAAIREGVDGYLLKPVKPPEVRQAIKEAFERRKEWAQLRAEEEEGRVLKRGLFSVDLEQHKATLDGKPLNLTPSEFKLLAHLMQNPRQAISPPDLVQAVRGYRPEYLHQARQVIKWYIHCLRRKIEPDPTDPRYIVNVRGVGYMLEP